MKKILLLGAAGQLGREWQAYLAKQHEYMLLPYTAEQLDVTRQEEVKYEMGEQQPQLVINCAAYTKVDEAEDERKKARKVNAMAVQNLAEICCQLEVKLIHFSTDYIFSGNREDRERFPEGYTEDHPANPVNWYGQTKWEGEQAIRASGCAYLIMRTSWLCGTYGSNFVKTMLQLADHHDRLDVVNDQFGSPAFAPNLVQNTWNLIAQGTQGTYHICSEGLISWADFAEAIFELAGQQVRVHGIPSSDYPTRAARPFFSKLDIRKIASIKDSKIIHWKAGLGQLLNDIL